MKSLVKTIVINRYLFFSVFFPSFPTDRECGRCLEIQRGTRKNIRKGRNNEEIVED